MPMKYENTIAGRFISRPNRFIAYVDINGRTECCHVKNTGRCRELLVPDTKTVLSISDNPKRKTKFDLIAVYKNDLLINIDSQAPNKAVYEWLKSGGEGEFEVIRPEYTVGDSRFDFYAVRRGKPAIIEVKGVTLEENGIVRFPDAPTERGTRHLKGLAELSEQGFDTAVFFAVQMRGMKYFEPNRSTDPDFADALSYACSKGVRIICRECDVTENSLSVSPDKSALLDVKINSLHH